MVGMPQDIFGVRERDHQILRPMVDPVPIPEVVLQEQGGGTQRGNSRSLRDHLRKRTAR